MRAFRHYHEATKHTPTSVRSGGRGLDWQTKPHPFKEYLDLQAIPLPDPSLDTAHPAPDAIDGIPGEPRPLDLAEISRLLRYGAGNIRKVVRGHGETRYFRTYASAGALYPNEIYLSASAVDGLAPGIYHFHPLEHALRLLRDGDARPYLARGAPGLAAAAPATIILSGIPWRTTWKYRTRGYRHLFWDAGMILTNLLALAASGGHAARVMGGFVDDEVDVLVGLDGPREMSLALMPLGEPSQPAPPAATPPPPIDHRVSPLSASEVEYPEIAEVHRATSLPPGEAAGWGSPPSGARSEPSGRSPEPCRLGIEKTIQARGSTRAFKRDAVSGEVLREILRRSSAPLPADWGPPLVEHILIVNAVDDIEPGAYRYADGTLEQLRLGDFREEGAYLCLEQRLGGDAAATCFLVAHLDRVAERLGDRGYRASQLEAGMVGGRMYLTAFACGTGATGLTFYDDEVSRFFGTDAEPMLVIAIGDRDPSRYIM